MTHSESTRLHRRIARLVTAGLVAAGAALTPLAKEPLPAVPSYMLAFGFAMIITNLLLAGLMFSRGVNERSKGSVQLGAAYWFVAILFFPLIAAFPDAVLPGGSLIGSKISAVWLWSFWHVGFGVLVLRYALAARRRERTEPHAPLSVTDEGVSRQLGLEIALCCAAVGALAWLGTAGLPLFPTIFMGPQGLFGGAGILSPATSLVVDVACVVVLARLKRPSNEQIWLCVGMVAACFDVWLTYHGTARFSVGWYVAKLGSLFTTLIVLVSLFVELTALYRRTADMNLVLEQQAHVDGLTGLANRRRFDQVLESECSRAGRGGHPLSLLLIDVDYFKRYNDRYGHLAGDDCLRLVAKAIESSVRRPSDLPARYGGEEFAVVLPMTAREGALLMAERIRESIAQLAVAHVDAGCGHITASIGTATTMATRADEGPALIAAADRALYQAKAQGRNRACEAAPDGESTDAAPGAQAQGDHGEGTGVSPFLTSP